MKRHGLAGEALLLLALLAMVVLTVATARALSRSASHTGSDLGGVTAKFAGR